MKIKAILVIPLLGAAAILGICLVRGRTHYDRGSRKEPQSSAPGVQENVDTLTPTKSKATEGQQLPDSTEKKETVSTRQRDEEILLSLSDTTSKRNAAQRLYLRFAESKDLQILELLKTSARTERDPEVRLSLLSYLRETTDADAIKIVCEALADPDSSVRQHAARSMAFIGSYKYANTAWILAPEGASKASMGPSIEVCRKMALDAVASALSREGDASIRQLLDEAAQRLTDAVKSQEGNK